MKEYQRADSPLTTQIGSDKIGLAGFPTDITYDIHCHLAGPMRHVDGTEQRHV